MSETTGGSQVCHFKTRAALVALCEALEGFRNAIVIHEKGPADQLRRYLMVDLGSRFVPIQIFVRGGKPKWALIFWDEVGEYPNMAVAVRSWRKREAEKTIGLFWYWKGECDHNPEFSEELERFTASMPAAHGVLARIRFEEELEAIGLTKPRLTRLDAP